jgi:hypothetical protein
MRAVVAGLPASARAQSKSDLAREIDQLRADIAAQQRQLQDQQRRLVDLERRLTTPLVAGGSAAALDRLRGAGAPDAAASVVQAPAGPSPVGQVPESERRPEIQALASVGGVLTPNGALTLEPSLEYANLQTNRFFFSGTEIVNAVFIGGLEATNARRNTLTPALSARYGLTNDIEITTRAPYVYRADRESSGVNTDALSRSVYGQGIGDVELGVNYQLPTNIGDAFYIANLRLKSPTGRGPFDVPYDSTGLQRRLPTGSGFWAVDPSVTLVKPVDPVVLFANLGYTINIAQDVDKTIPGVGFFGRVDPGDALHTTLGLGFAINDKISLSLGYEHNYLMSTSSVVSGVTAQSEDLQIGSFLAGVSYQLTPRTTANFNVYVGATRDAPDVRLLLSVPMTFDLLGGGKS